MNVKASSPHIRDLVTEMRNAGRHVIRGGAGTIELAHYRGFQGGYEQAMLDHKKGRMKLENAFLPSRMK